VGLGRGGRRADLAVGAHNPGGDEAIAGEAILAPKPAVTAAQRKTRNAGVRHHTAWHGQPERLRLPVNISPERSALHVDEALLDIDLDAAHREEVDQDTIVHTGQAGN